jgi:hypothetical protein
LDFATASDSPHKDTRTKKKRMGSSYGSGLDFLTATQAEEDGLTMDRREPTSGSKKRGRRTKGSDSLGGDSAGEEGAECSLHISDLLGEPAHGGGDRPRDGPKSSRAGIARVGKGVLSLGSSLAAQRREFELEVLRRGVSESDAYGDNEEDVFTFYAWSSSRQPRPNIQRERKLLRDSVRQGAVEATKDGFVRMK